MAGKRVLVVDCDPQANATVGLGFTPENAGRNMYDVFMSGIEGLPETRIADIIKKTSSGIDLAPSHLDLVGADPYLYRVKGRTGILMRALMGVKDRYDLILIDTPPSIGQLVINGLYAADHIIVTLDSGTFALDGISTLATIFSDIREDLGKDIRMDLAIVTRWGEGLIPECPKPAEERKDLISLIRDIFAKKPEPTPEELQRAEEQKTEHERLLAMMAEVRRQFPSVYTIPYSPLVYESQKRGLPISHFASGSSAGVAYKEIAYEVMRWI
jgi:chromosome partitioning protein